MKSNPAGRGGAARPYSRALLPFLALRGGGVIGNQMLAVALSYRLYQLTNSAADLGLIGLVQFLPALLLALPAGHAIDRRQSRTIIGWATAVDLLNLLLLLALSLAGAITAGWLYASAVLTGVSRAYSTPAYQAQLPALAPRSHLGRALALYSTVFRCSLLVGPVIGGMLYELGPAVVFAACFVVALAALGLTFFLPPGPSAPSAEPASLKSLFAGVAYVVQRPEIFGAMTLDLFGVLLAGVTAILPIFARDILHVGPIGFGLMRAAPAVGGLLVAGLLVRARSLRRGGWIIYASVVGFGLCTCGFALSRDFGLSLAMLAMAGGANMLGANIRQTLVQLRTPDAMRGRVSSVNSIFIGASNQLGQFESGVTAYWFGAGPSVLIGGVGALAVAAIGLLLFPALRQVDKLDEHGAPPDLQAEPSAPG